MNDETIFPAGNPEREEQCMMHEHGNEFQVRIVREDETVELSGWVRGKEEVAQAITRLGRSQTKAYSLQVRNLRSATCLHTEPTIVEFPLTLTAAESQ